jgi:hypothetical protein
MNELIIEMFKMLNDEKISEGGFSGYLYYFFNNYNPINYIYVYYYFGTNLWEDYLS